MRVFRMALAGVIGLSLFFVLFNRQYAVAMARKAVGGAEPCPWNKLVSFPWDDEKFAEIRKRSAAGLKVVAEDAALGIEQVQTPGRAFWVRKTGGDMTGTKLIGWVLAEQEWLAAMAPDQVVRKGDVVMDVGAHIGTFGDEALRRGASKVIMVEPDPTNLECIRRNYREEIASGRVLVIPEGAWSSEKTLEFNRGVANSGTGSLVVGEQGGETIKIPVRTIDSMLKTVGIEKVDFIKMDIEGAEREALQGAAETLRKSQPRLLLDMYHLIDDAVVLPPLIQRLNPAYRAECAACTVSSQSRHGAGSAIIPYAIFYSAR